MDEFRANGRDSPLEEPEDSAPLISLLSQPSRQPPTPPPHEYAILCSRDWRCGTTADYASDIYNRGAVYSDIACGAGGATGEMYGRLYRPQEPFGGVLVVNAPARPTSSGLPRPLVDDSPVQRPPRSGRSATRRRSKQPNHCVFCKNNNELPCVYRSHILKDSQGRISCPILRVYTCPTCGANGDLAHTVKYCPQRQETGQQGRQEAPSPLPLCAAGRPITKRGCR